MVCARSCSNRTVKQYLEVGGLLWNCKAEVWVWTSRFTWRWSWGAGAGAGACAAAGERTVRVCPWMWGRKTAKDGERHGGEEDKGPTGGTEAGRRRRRWRTGRLRVGACMTAPTCCCSTATLVSSSHTTNIGSSAWTPWKRFFHTRPHEYMHFMSQAPWTRLISTKPHVSPFTHLRETQMSLRTWMKRMKMFILQHDHSEPFISVHRRHGNIFYYETDNVSGIISSVDTMDMLSVHFRTQNFD